ncbi:MAG: hypothetical protein WAZ19_13080 [Anaerolineae bacterium]
MKQGKRLLLAALLVTALAACDGSGNTSKTPPPSATVTPNAVNVPAVESGGSHQMSPVATPDSASPLPTPAP